MVIRTQAELENAKLRCNKLQAFLNHASAGDYPEDEKLYIQLYHAIENYYKENGGLTWIS